MLGDQFRQRMIKAVMIVSDFLLFYREGKHRFLLRDDTGSPGVLSIGGLIEADHLTGTPIAALTCFLQVRDQKDRDLRKLRDNGRRQSRNRFVEILANVLFSERQGREVIGERLPKRDHLPAVALSELADTQIGIGNWGH